MYGGNVLSCSTVERATCTIQELDRGIELTNGSLHEHLRSAEDLKLRIDDLDIVRAALIFLGIQPTQTHFTLHISTTIPMRAGLAGSTAMLAAIVGALNAYMGLGLNSYQIAETIRKVEWRVMKVVCGFQDQHMAVFGGLNFMNFAGKESLEQLDDEPLATIEPLGSLIPHPPLLLAHTGVQHHSGSVHRTPRERWLSGEVAVREGYTEIARLAIGAKRAIIEGDWYRLGGLMTRNHEIVRDLGGSGISNERLIAAAIASGAIGAKLAGAGGGGTIIVLTQQPDEMSAALQAAGADSIHTPLPCPGLTISEE